MREWKTWKFVVAAGGWGVASTLTASLLYIAALVQASHYGSSVTTVVLLAVTVPLFWIGSYMAWSKEHDENEKLRDPVIEFEIGHSSVKQRIAVNQNAFHRRIKVTNKSDALAKDCELALVSCTAEIPGLTPDSTLQVKDAPNGARQTDINRGDTKHFDLFVAFLTPETEWPQNVFVWTPNHPEIPRYGKAEYEIVLRLTGSNFSPRRWKGVVLMGEGDAEILRLEPLAA